MCGIVGIYSPFFSQEFDNEILSMSQTIHHRGPDSSGVWMNKEDNIYFAHNRLSVVDLSPAGHQPMISNDGRYVIVFNGEIYNHLEIRKQFSKDGHSHHWIGTSDTETILASIQIYGLEHTLKNIVGMFAFAIWDTVEKTLTVARDRFGEKPLYWVKNSSFFVFSSEISAIENFSYLNKEISRDSLSLLLRLNYIPSPFSIYKNVFKLQKGTFLTVRVENEILQTQEKVYWDEKEMIENARSTPFTGSAVEAVKELDRKLSTSIQMQMLADVPLGAFLSGGVDSSVVVAIMQQNSAKKIKTFSIGFHDQSYNEAHFAKNVANHIGTDHYEWYVSDHDILDIVPSLHKIYSEPFADSSQLPTFIVSKLAKEHVTVSLSGDAGDELFGGYNSYSFAPKIWNFLRFTPFHVKKSLASYLTASEKDSFQKLGKVITSKSREDFYYRLISHTVQPHEIVLSSSDPLNVYNNNKNWPNHLSFQHWMMAVDFMQYMTDDVLVKVDRAAMANSLETRVPMLDHRIVEFAWSLPLDYKIRNGCSKWVLKEVLHQYVPKSLFDRPKKGFSVPLSSWLKGPLKEWAAVLLDKDLLKKQGFFNVDMVSKIWEQHLTGTKDNSSLLWSILMFQDWYTNKKSNL